MFTETQRSRFATKQSKLAILLCLNVDGLTDGKCRQKLSRTIFWVVYKQCNITVDNYQTLKKTLGEGGKVFQAYSSRLGVRSFSTRNEQPTKYIQHDTGNKSFSIKRLVAVSCYVTLRVMLCGSLRLHLKFYCSNRYRATTSRATKSSSISSSSCYSMNCDAKFHSACRLIQAFKTLFNTT